MMQTLVAYVATVVLFTGIDMVWLLGPGRAIYVGEMGPLLRAAPNLPAAIAFYLLYAAGLIFFAIAPALRGGPSAALAGAALGLIAYGTYDLTGLAVINGFTTRIALIDMAWGTILSGVVAFAVVKLLTAFA